MRVNNINNLSFKRAIEIQSNTNDVNSSDIDKSTRDVIRTIRREKSPYHGDSRKLLITFFSKYIKGLRNSYKQADVLKINGKVYLFTSDEARKVAQINNEATEEKAKLREAYLNNRLSGEGEDDNSAKEKEIFKFLQSNINKQRDERILELVEDGKSDKDGKIKPFSLLTFDMKPDGRLDRVVYASSLLTARGESTKTLFL